MTSLLFALAMLSSQASAQSGIDSLMAPYSAPGMPGASVLVMRDGKVAFSRSYGLADVDSQVAVTPQSNFRLASLTKQFTATAIMMLVEHGRLSYDDDITRLVDGLPAFARGVTVRNLLNHTSGLPDYEDFVPDSQTTQVHDADVPRLISNARAVKFPAGSKYAYSNAGYALLALIVEHVTKQHFAGALHDMIFAPLGMDGTVAYEAGRSTVTLRAYGHSIRSGSVRRTDQSSTSAVLGDGGIYTSIADLAKWDDAIATHRLVSAESQRLAWTPPALPAGGKTEYGFGWFVDTVNGAQRVRHNGETRGFTNGVIRYPAQRLAIYVLTNRGGGEPWNIAQRIAELYLGAAFSAPPWKP